MSSEDRINPLFLKAAVIVLLSIILLIPLHQVESLIGERSSLRDNAAERVAMGVGHSQTVGALIMNVPVTRVWREGDRSISSTKIYRVLPASVEITGSIGTQPRHSGIYSVTTFLAQMHLTGSIGEDFPSKELEPEIGVTKTVGDVTLFLALSDPAGIRTLAGIRLDGRLLPVAPVSQTGLKGVLADVGALNLTMLNRLNFSIDLDVAGTERLQLLPLGKSTHVNLTSSWPSPSFRGAFSPDLAPQVQDRGFAADWRVLQINRDFPQVWTDDSVTNVQLERSAFGVDFYQPVDIYQRDYRAIHYAVLFIALTFMGLFLWEHTVDVRVHAIQYAMIGMALSVFYLVLIALSEHVGFGTSYGLAAGSMCLLLTVYFSGWLRSRVAGLLAGAATGTCYSLLYLLILSEENALLFGALALFGVLAAIMIATRKLDWYRVADFRRRAE
jgi:inner membrane protein